MKALDTNVIIRFLVKDDIHQAESVRKLFFHHENAEEKLYIPLPVTLETLYVLDSVYEYTRDEITHAFDMMTSMPLLLFERFDAVKKMIQSSKKYELEDILIGAAALDAGCNSTYTFDKKAGKSELFELVR